MADTTPDAIYRALMARLRVIFNTLLPADNRIIMSPVATHVGAFSNKYVELIVPGRVNVLDPEVGTNIIVETFDVACFLELHRDEAGDHEKRLADATDGVVSMRNTLHGDANVNAATGLIQWTPTNGVWPIILQSWSAAVPNPRDPSWIMITDTFRMAYEIAGTG